MARKTVPSDWKHVEDDIFTHKELNIKIEVDPDDKSNDRHVETELEKHNLYSENVHSFVYKLRKRAGII